MGALMIELLGKSLVELQGLFEEHKIQKFRAKQLIDYIYHRHIFVFQDMTQFPKTLRDWLDSNCIISIPKVITQSVSPDGKTQKLLLELTDYSRIEAVLMEQHMAILYVFPHKLDALWAVFFAHLHKGDYLETYRFLKL